MAKRLPDGREVSDEKMLTMQNEAKEYVRKAVEDVYHPAVERADDIIKRAIREIVDIFVKYGYVRGGSVKLLKRDRDKVTAILTRLQEELLDLIDVYSTIDAEDKEEDMILVYLSKPFAGLTAEQRVKTGVDILYKRGIMPTINDDTRRGGRSNVREDIIDAMATVIGLGTLKRLVETELSRTWQFRWQMEHKEAKYVHVFRGSSYNCEVCDATVSLGWQEVNGREIIPPLHPNCRCYCVYM